LLVAGIWPLVSGYLFRHGHSTAFDMSYFRPEIKSKADRMQLVAGSIIDAELMQLIPDPWLLVKYA
jgi:hypothetical protein